MPDDRPADLEARIRQLEEELSLSTQTLEWVADSSAAAVFVGDAERNLSYVNPAAASLLGYNDPTELVGLSGVVLYKDLEQRELVFQMLELYGQIEPLQLVFRRVDGTGIPAFGGVRALKDQDGGFAGIVGVFEDISHRTELQGQVTYQANLLRSIKNVLDLPTQCERESEVWAGCLREATTLTESRIGAIGAFRDDGHFQLRAVETDEGHPTPSPEDLIAIEPKGLILWVRQEGVSVITNKPAGHPMFEAPPPGHPRIETFLGVPLRDAGRVMGMIGLGNRTGGYLAEDRAAMEILATAMVRALGSTSGPERR